MPTPSSKPVLTQKPGQPPVLAKPAAAPAVAPAPLPFQAKNISVLRNREPLIRACVFGPAKCGKTTLLGTFPGVAIADYDGDGVEALVNPYFSKKYGNREDIWYETFMDQVDEYGLFVQKEAIKMAFFQGVKWINSALHDPKVKTIGLDTLTTMGLAASYVGLMGTNSRKRSNTLINAKQDHLLLLTKADFGAEMRAVQQILDQLMVVRSKHVVVLAHEKTETNEAGLIIGRSVLITGDTNRAQLGRWFADMWYLDAKPNGVRTLICQPKGVYKGVGSRLGMPPEIENPDYGKIMAALTKGRSK